MPRLFYLFGCWLFDFDVTVRRVYSDFGDSEVILGDFFHSIAHGISQGGIQSVSVRSSMVWYLNSYGSSPPNSLSSLSASIYSNRSALVTNLIYIYC